MLCTFDTQNFTLKDVDGSVTTRVVFMLLFQEESILKERIERICDNF